MAVVLSPSWFFGLDVAFELVFTIITLALSFYSFKIYKLTGQKQPKLFGISFLFFSIAYLIQSFFNFAIISTLGEEICNFIKIQNIRTFQIFGTYFYMVFFLIGIVSLVYMTLKTNDKKIYYLLLSITLISLFLSSTPGYLFYTLTSLLLIFVVIFYTKNYNAHKKLSSLLVLLAFIFLFISHLHYIFATNSPFFYALGHILELITYVLIFINLILIKRK